jgi:hypothetical protein
MSAALGEAANLYRVGLGDTRSVTADRARGAGRSLPALAPKLLTLSTLLFALTLAGCARHSERQTRAVPSEARTCQPAKVQPAPPPDCEFRGADLKTVDPAQFARLKAAYERQCHQRAEKAARDRLRWLRAKGC